MLKIKHFITLGLIATSLSLVSSEFHSQENRERPKFGKILSQEEKALLKNIHMSLRETFESADDELKDYMRQLRGKRPQKSSRRKIPKEVLEFIKSSKEIRIAKLNEITSLVDELRQSRDQESAIATIEKLAPMLKSLPPPPRRRMQNCGNEDRAPND